MAYRFVAGAVALVLLAVPATVRADGSPVSGEIGVTSDFVFRGISQTFGDPSVQAGLRYQDASGFYVAGWAGTVDFGPGSGVDAEVDALVGYTRAFGSISLDLAYARYMYPGATPSGSLDYAEWLVTAGVGERVTLTGGWSGDVFASGQDGTYVQAAYTLPLAGDFSLTMAAGHYRLPSPWHDYSHGELALRWTRGPWQARTSLHTTSDSAEAAFPGLAARDHLEAALKYVF